MSEFFGRPESEFTELVSSNPDLKFIELIDKLREKGVEIDQEKLKEFRKRQRESRQFTERKSGEKKERSH